MQSALASEHSLGDRVLDVKVATPKVVLHALYLVKHTVKIVLKFEPNVYNIYIQEVMRVPSKKVSRIFVARVLPAVTEAEFRR